MDPPSLAACTLQLVAAVQDDSCEVQAFAWQLLDLLPPNALAPHTTALVRQLVSKEDALVSVLTKLELSAGPEVRAALWKALEPDCWTVRHNALQTLEKQPDKGLAVHVPALLRSLLSIWQLEADDDEHIASLHDQTIELLDRVDKWERAKHMQPLLDVLRDTGTRTNVRQTALEVIYRLPPAAVAPHAQLLLQALRQPDEGDHCTVLCVRELAAQALLELEVPVLEALAPALLAAAADDVACDGAVLVLSKLPPAMLAEQIPAVLRSLVVRSPVLGEDGIRGLGRVDPATLAAHASELHAPLCHTDATVRRNALVLLGEFPLQSIAVHAEALRKLLSDPDPLIGKMAVELLGRVPIPNLADELTGLLDQPEYAAVRAGVLLVLGELAGSAAPLPAAVRLLHDPDPAVRASALRTLARLDSSALQEHAGLLLTALGDSEVEVRTAAMEVFVQLPAATLTQHVQACLQGLQDASWELKMAAIEKIGTSVLAAHTAQLLGMARDHSNHGLSSVAWTVIERLPPAVLAPHLAWLLSSFGKVRSAHCWMVQKIAREVVCSMSPDDVATVLLNQDGARKADILESILSHLPADIIKLHVPLLMNLIRDPDPDERVRARAFDALAKTCTELLLVGLTDRAHGVRCAAINTLCRLPPDALLPHAAKVLRMLWDLHSDVREAAMQRAEEMRSQFGAAPQLREQLRRAALEACNIAREAVAGGLMC
jgi:HEAT repeat protein